MGRKKGCTPWNKNKTGVYKEKTIQKMKNSALGRKHTKEAKIKMSKTRKGKRFTEEHCKNISLSKIGEKNPAFKGGRLKSGYGYISIRIPNHPFSQNGYYFEHRLVAEKCINRYLKKTEVIHHINGVRDDNRPENLYLFKNQSKHISYENLKIKPNLISNLKLCQEQRQTHKKEVSI